MKHLTRFSTAARDNLVGLGVLLVIWFILAQFFPSYILPSPVRAFRAAPTLLNAAFLSHLGLTLYRVLAGFILAFGVGSVAGILAFTLHLTPHLNSLMVALQVIPGAILGIILLLVLGIGSRVPIALVALVTLPTVAINTANALAKRDIRLEHYLLSAGGRRRHLVRYLYLPTLIPTMQSNLSIGFGMAIKVVVLGEFIGAQTGLGYLLNVAAIHFNMQAVLLYLCVVLLISVGVEVVQRLLFDLFWGRYLYPG